MVLQERIELSTSPLPRESPQVSSSFRQLPDQEISPLNQDFCCIWRFRQVS